MALQVNRINLVFGLIAWLGIVQFAISVRYAVSLYADDYSVAENFLSDLGRTVTFDGTDNSNCANVFNRSVIILGITLLPFFAVMPSVLQRGRFAIRAFGLLSSLGLIGIGLTPYDLYFIPHHAALVLWIGPMLLTVVTLLICAIVEGISSKMLSAGSLLLIAGVSAYALAGTYQGYVVFQKVMAVLACVWFCTVFVTISLATIHSIRSRRMMIEKQANQYLKRIQKGHRRKQSRPRIDDDA